MVDHNGPQRTSRRSQVGEIGILMRQMGLALSIPGLLLSGPLVGYGLGWLAATYLKWPAWVAGVGLVLGLVSGIRESILVIRKLSRDAEQKNDK